ncbi:MAG: transposase [Proteobacteria bacterium]|nr:transposase [Pseudomonadota bacterium]
MCWITLREHYVTTNGKLTFSSIARMVSAMRIISDELKGAFEQDKQEWAKKMKDLLTAMSKGKNATQGGQVADAEAAEFVARYRAILELGEVKSPAPEKKAKCKRGRTAKSKSRNLLERLANFETKTRRFLFTQSVPFTNNQGERDIPVTKVQQKNIKMF